ncbi:MAG TPA: TetR/AcrR family transcriptional regulator [Clostridia bacterium]|nr:TetR/AcrR family transcriptional regulator [Clostridia bacterium]
MKSGQHSETRQQILRAALRHFARHGYTATSVKQIVGSARVSKPALYYYFGDKAGLFQALVDTAHDERFRLIQEAAQRGRTIAEKLEEIVAVIFEYTLQNQELMRLAFATAFTASDNTPGCGKCREKGRRNFEFLRTVMAEAQASGELDSSLAVDDLAMSIYGQVNSYIVLRLLVPDCPLNRQTAVNLVQLFLKGAAGPSRKRSKINGAGRSKSRPAVSRN